MHLLFAGAESKRVRHLLKDMGVRKVLVSYHYVKRRNVPIEWYFDNFDWVALDSGGFTMIAEARKKGSVNFAEEIKKHEAYLQDYLDFIETHAGKFYWVANYDVDLIVGTKTVIEWNKYFERIEDKFGQRICYIAHDYSIPYNHLYEYFERYNYIGVAGDENFKKDNVGYFGQVYNLSKQHQKLTHGFAMTNFVSFQSFPFFTCDSTTYLGGDKYGTTYVYNGAYFETWDYHHKYRRKSLGKQCSMWNIDHEKFINDDRDAVTSFNIKSWMENEKLFNQRTKPAQWWSNY